MTVDVIGLVDPTKAIQLVECVTMAPAYVHVVLDFTHAAVSDSALPILADTMRTATAAHVSIRGLGRHQERVLRYLGVDTAPIQGEVALKL